MVTLEGTRPMLVEIQALVDSGGPAPAPVGRPGPDRLAMLLAVLHRHAGVACGDQDVCERGGRRAHQRASGDLAVMLSITSSLRGKYCRAVFGIWRGRAGWRGARRAARSA